MKRTVSKVVAVALALLLVMGMASIASAAQVLYVNQAVNVRTGPGTDYVTLGWLDKGDSVQATGYTVDGWTQIQYSTYELGYVKNTYLSSSATSGSGYSYNYYCAPSYVPANGKVTPRVAEAFGPIYKTTSKLNIRSGPSTDYSVIGTLTKGQQVTRVGQDGKWFKILTNEGVNAYVSSKYLKADSAPVTTVCTTPVYSYEPDRPYYYPTAVSTSKLYSTTALRVRSGPGTNYSIIGGLQRGEAVTYRATSGSWYQITTGNGLTGYAHSNYLTSTAPVVRYTSTPVSSYSGYSSCSSCGTYYYGSTCNSCSGGAHNGSTYSTRCTTPVFSSSESTSTVKKSATTKELIKFKIDMLKSSATTLPNGSSYVVGYELEFPAGRSVAVAGGSRIGDDIVRTISFTDAGGNVWIADNIPESKLTYK